MGIITDSNGVDWLYDGEWVRVVGENDGGYLAEDYDHAIDILIEEGYLNQKGTHND